MKQYDVTNYSPSFVTADIAIMSVIEDELAILLIERKDEPHKGSWALPGGFLDVATDLDARATAVRELEEETGLKNIYLEELGTFSRKHRDPREKVAERDGKPLEIRIISVAHVALVQHDKIGQITAGSDASDSRWFKISELPSLGFDHREIIQKAVERVRGKINYSNVGFELLPAKFTMAELQKVFENVTGEKLDRNNFRTKMLKLGILIATKEKKKEGPGQPAPFYRLDKLALKNLKGRPLF